MKQKNSEQEKDCPFCEISEEAVDKLKSSQGFENRKNKKKKIPWNWYIIFLIISIIAGFLITYQSQDQSVDEDNSLAPNFTSQDVFGQQVSLSDFEGQKPVLLVFWATWCSYCKQELPDLKEFSQKYKSEIKVIAIDSGETKKIIKDYIQKNNIDFLVLLDEEREIWNKYLVRGTPSHFLINEKREIVVTWPGLVSMNDLEKMLSYLEE